MFVLILVFVRLWGFVDKTVPSRRTVRTRGCPPRRVSDLGIFVLVFTMLVAVGKWQFCEPPGYSNREEMMKDLKKITKKYKSIRDSDAVLKNQSQKWMSSWQICELLMKSKEQNRNIKKTSFLGEMN